jgi:hypothetical protein
MTRVLVTGSRDWENRAVINQALFCFDHRDPTLVVGDCPTGGDAIALNFAEDHQWPIERFEANWDTYHKAAGPRRNKEMVNSGADVCLAFIKKGSKGAANCAMLAEKAGIQVIKFTE